jgi:hypothetical protein
MITEIKVTQEDIDKGVIKACEACPISLALHRAFPKSAFVSVLEDHVYFIVDGRDIGLTLPSLVTEFIKAFDKSEKVEPFSFTINHDSSLT